MKLLTLDIKAALLYLQCFQYMENTNSETIAQDLSLEITWLHENGYPDPTTIVYDNDGIPQIEWKFPAFEPELFYESINYESDYFQQPYPKQV